MEKMRNAKFKIGQVVKHRVYPFRGVIFDIDPVFNNTEEWWQAIPAEIRPARTSLFIISLRRTRRPSTSLTCQSKIYFPTRQTRRFVTPTSPKFSIAMKTADTNRVEADCTSLKTKGAALWPRLEV